MKIAHQVYMGNKFLDQYSLLHFATGIIAYFFNLTFKQWFLIHLLFEVTENTMCGIRFINHYLEKIWPGGKPGPDAPINILGDQISTLFGWLFAYILDYFGDRYKWYKPHLLK